MGKHIRTSRYGRKVWASGVMNNLHSGLRTRIEAFLKTERRRRRKTLSLDQLLDTLTRVAQAESLETLLDDAVQTTAKLSGAAGTAISVMKTPAADTLSLFRCFNLEPAEAEDLIFALDGSLVTAVGNAAGPLVIADLVGKLGPRSKTRAVLRRLGCEVIIPLVSHGQMRGLLLLAGHADGSHLTEREIKLLETYAVCLSMAVESLLLSAARSR